MKRSFLSHVMLSLAILALLWNGQGFGTSYVWCMADDGAAHLESTLENHCGSADRGENLGAAGQPTLAADRTCGPCIDHAPIRELLQNQQRLLHPPAPLLALPLPSFSLLHSEAPRQLSLLARQSQRSPLPLLILRTTVLRC